MKVIWRLETKFGEGFRVQAGDELVEDVVIALIPRLTADPGLLKKVMTNESADDGEL